jgi:hypothetical protein
MEKSKQRCFAGAVLAHEEIHLPKGYGCFGESSKVIHINGLHGFYLLV